MRSEKRIWSTVIKRLIGWLNSDAPLSETNQTGQDETMEVFSITFDATHCAKAVRVPPDIPPADALAALNLPPYHGVLVVHGGAGQMDQRDMDVARQFLIATVAKLAEKHRLLIVDGGTQTGTAQILGEARAAVNGTYPLVGVVPEGRVRYPGLAPSAKDRNDLNPSHSHFILVQGSQFGDESALLVGILRAAGQPGAALVINAGDIVLTEVKMHSDLDNPLITLQGSGRLANSLADPTSVERRQLPSSARLHVIDVSDPQGGIDLLTDVLQLSDEPDQTAPDLSAVL